MGYVLIKDLTKVNYSHGNNGRCYIVIHYTGNQIDTAKSNANYFRSTIRNASAHFFVDQATVYQVVDESDTAWAVGANYGSDNLFGTVSNENSISIEMCSADGEIAPETILNTVELTKILMTRYNIPITQILRHYDVCSKRCPGWSGWLPTDEHLWESFKAMLTGPVKADPAGKWKKEQLKENIGWWWKNPDGTYPKSQWALLANCYYYFGADGYIKEDVWLNYNNHWYWINPGGTMKTGWFKWKEQWFYLEEKNNVKEYPQGAMHLGWSYLGGSWFYFNDGKSGGSIGAMAEDCLLKLSDGVYYLKKGGYMAKEETLTVKGTVYTFDDSGRAKKA